MIGSYVYMKEKMFGQLDCDYTHACIGYVLDVSL
jgi:hypothetical protein